MTHSLNSDSGKCGFTNAWALSNACFTRFVLNACDSSERSPREWIFMRYALAYWWSSSRLNCERSMWLKCHWRTRQDRWTQKGLNLKDYIRLSKTWLELWHRDTTAWQRYVASNSCEATSMLTRGCHTETHSISMLFAALCDFYWVTLRHW